MGKLWSVERAQDTPGATASSDPKCDQEVNQHEHLPEQAKVLRTPGKTPINHRAKEIRVDKKYAQKQKDKRHRAGDHGPRLRQLGLLCG
jgi:hypothetical protein